MASRAFEANSTWPYTPFHSLNASIWQGNKQDKQDAQPSVRGEVPHSEDVSSALRRGWPNNDPYAHHQHTDTIDNNLALSSSAFLTSPGPTSESQGGSATLYMGNLEPWMDYEYVSQVIRLMGWDRVTPSNSLSSNFAATGSNTTPSVTIKIPPPPQNMNPLPNNPGYCLLTFSTASHAASVLGSLYSMQISGGNNNVKDYGGGGSLGTGGNSAPRSVLMPNSTRPFQLKWVTPQTSLPNPMSIPDGLCLPGGGGLHPHDAPLGLGLNPSVTSSFGLYNSQTRQRRIQPIPPQHQEQKEYSIFVGDLAPETSNSDLVAVFKNPVLGLRNDREPKFIRPFYSCKSAKIMLDPVSGMSRGYGFVRFTDEADQQRALVEMHGLYCLSRPMRVSPATAKFKQTSSTVPAIINQPSMLNTFPEDHDEEESYYRPGMIRSVSSPVAAASNTPPHHGSSSVGSSPVNGYFVGKEKSDGLQETQQQSASQISPRLIAQIKQIAEAPQPFPSSSTSTSSMFAPQGTFESSNLPSYGGAHTSPGPRDEGWTHQAQARAILGNLIGPNGEQLTSTDPYNTTVFVGGLSPLISEETLRTFFVPFGEIHYVKVPVGKHCGFVQFVRKEDAERAIEHMQGFPIGGGRIRLSWGRSQYKAAQAAAQAAQAAQAEQTTRLLGALLNGRSPTSLHITQEQAIRILQTLRHYTQSDAVPQSAPSAFQNSSGYTSSGTGTPEYPISFGLASGQEDLLHRPSRSSFSPFSFPANQNGQNSYAIAESVLHQQQNTVSSLPTLHVPFATRSFSVPSPVGMKKSDNNSSPQSSAGSQSGSGVQLEERATPFAFGSNPSYYQTIQARDLLRSDSQSLLSRVPPLPHSSFQQAGFKGDMASFVDEDDEKAVQRFNGVFAGLSLDGGERDSRGHVGTEMYSVKNVFGEKRGSPAYFSSPKPSGGNENP